MNRPGSWILPGLLAGVMLGIATADAGWLGEALAVVAAAAGGLVVAARLRHAPWLRMAGFAAVVLLIGIAAGGIRTGIVPAPGGPTSLEAMPTSLPVRLVGAVADEPVPRGDEQDVVLDDLRRGELPIGGRLIVRVPRAVAVNAGDLVGAEVTIRPPDPADPEESAYRDRLRRQGIGAIGSAWELAVVGHRSALIADAFGGVRRWLLDGLVKTVPEPEAALGAGILLGVRAGIDPAIRDAFAVAGLSHVVAISGWNVAIVVALIASATRRLRERFGPVVPAVVAMSAVCGYVVLVGASPAVVRAALMAGALLAARLGGSPAHALSALMAAVLLMLAVTPTALWDIGFQLSALATAGLILLAAPIEARLARWPAWLRTPVALTVAAQLATLPVLLATFGQVSLVAPLANVIVVPLIPAVMAGTAVAALLGALAAEMPLPIASDIVGWLAGGAAWLPLRGLIVAGTTAAAVPLAAVPVAGAPWLTAAWYPCLGLAVYRLTRRGREPEPNAQPLDESGHGGALLPEAAALDAATVWVTRPRRAALALVMAVSLGTTLTGPDGRLHVTVLDIGQGDAILIEAPDGAVGLVDAGVDPDLTLRRVGQSLPFHQRKLDVVVLSHPHQDHLGGFEEILRRYEVALFVDGGRRPETTPHQRILEAVRHETGARLVSAEAGRVIPIGAARLEVLYPSATDVAAPPPESDINNTSVVVCLRYGRFSMLLTGDAEAPVESLLVERELLDPVDVLKVGHHGSDSSTTPAFLAALQPSVAVISDGVDNEYGHPHRSTLDNLAQVPGLRIFRTDQDGSVEVTTDGTSFSVTSASGRAGPLPAGRASSADRTGTIRAWETDAPDERIAAAGAWGRRLPDRQGGRRLRRRDRGGRPRRPHPREDAGRAHAPAGVARGRERRAVRRPRCRPPPADPGRGHLGVGR